MTHLERKIYYLDKEVKIEKSVRNNVDFVRITDSTRNIPTTYIGQPDITKLYYDQLWYHNQKANESFRGGYYGRT